MAPSPFIPPPAIAPVAGESPRPFWSVMIPTFNPSRFFPLALESILAQAPDPAQMQIHVVDDCSTTTDVQSTLRRVAGDRITFSRQPRNAGLVGNFNACIAQSRGIWVHILHQDDLALPGFYTALEAGIRAHPDVGAAYCDCITIGPVNAPPPPPPVDESQRGRRDDFYLDIGARQFIECASIAVRRDVYESLGGFRPDAGYVTDWEMWVRIACKYPFFFEPRFLACYRLHGHAASINYLSSGAHRDDAIRAIDTMQSYMPDTDRQCIYKKARAFTAYHSVRLGRHMLQQGNYRQALREFAGALKCSASWQVGARLAMHGSKGMVDRLRGKTNWLGDRMKTDAQERNGDAASF